MAGDTHCAAGRTMGSHLDYYGYKGTHFVIDGSQTFDAESMLSVNCVDGPSPRTMRVTAVARLPRIVGPVSGHMHRTGFLADGKTQVTDRRPLKVRWKTVPAANCGRLVSVPTGMALAVAGANPDITPQKRRKIARRGNLVAWETEFSFELGSRSFYDSDKDILRRAGGDTSVLYHTGFRVSISVMFSSANQQYPIAFDIYCRAPVSFPFSPVVMPQRARMAIRAFLGCATIAGRDAEGSFCVVKLRLLHDMARSGDAVHEALARAIYDNAVAGFVTGEHSVAILPMRADIFKLNGVEPFSVAETFIALSVISQLPLGFIFNSAANSAVALPGDRWVQLYSTGDFKMHLNSRPLFSLGPRLELKPMFAAATCPRSTRRYWIDPGFAAKLPELRRRLTSFGRRVAVQ